MRGKIRPVLDNFNIIDSFFSLSNYLSGTNIIVDSLISKLETYNNDHKSAYTNQELEMIKIWSILKYCLKL